MFEGKRPLPHEMRKPDRPDSEAEGDACLLRLSWTDLRAKLHAARELRATMARAADPAQAADEASFDSHSAHHLAKQHEDAREESKSSVNPITSTNLKHRDSNKGLSENANGKLFRGRQ